MRIALLCFSVRVFITALELKRTVQTDALVALRKSRCLWIELDPPPRARLTRDYLIYNRLPLVIPVSPSLYGGTQRTEASFREGGNLLAGTHGKTEMTSRGRFIQLSHTVCLLC
jgi:hypothetical protein